MDQSVQNFVFTASRLEGRTKPDPFSVKAANPTVDTQGRRSYGGSHLSTATWGASGDPRLPVIERRIGVLDLAASVVFW
jgi:hypothetical protein